MWCASFRLTVLCSLFLVACGDDDDDVVVFDAAPADGPTLDARPDATPPADARPSPDARPADLSCHSDAGPPNGPAPDPLTIAGVVRSLQVGPAEPLPGATIEARTAAGELSTTTTSGKDSSYSISIATGGEPLVGSLRVLAPDHLATSLFPPFPLTDNVGNLTLLVLPQVLFDLIENFSGLDQDPALGFGILQMEDCAGNPIEGAVVTLHSGTTATTRVVYGSPGNDVPDPDLPASAGSNLVFLFNLAPGVVTATAEVAGTALFVSPLRAAAGEASLGQILP